MLFNSFQFLLIFLPAALFASGVASRLPALRIPTLIVFSLVFYGVWDPRLVPLLLGSILVNWLAAYGFTKTRHDGFVWAAILADLIVLAGFKYTNFLLGSVDALLGRPIVPLPIVLPLGISFFTFHHIMYLVDLRRGRIGLCALDRYILYICFFPQLIAGPLARGRQVMHQFGRDMFEPGWERRCVLGIMFIVIGLMQKVFLGDWLAGVIGPVFAAARAGPITDGSAWLTLGFGFQIFFDFSGYSDIAVGIALILGIELPQNFNAPYQARSIQDFWTRWHMTLTLFLRDYLFLPLCDIRIGGRRHVAAAMVLTMTLCGLWHGAGWSFVIWGLLHGLALALASLWPRFGLSVPPVASRITTVAFVLATAILFGTDSLDALGHILTGLGHAPVWRDIRHAVPILIAALCAFTLPPSRLACHGLIDVPHRSFGAAAAALCLVGVLVKLGSADSYDFVYFQF